MYDVVFISYDEPNADENWKLLSELIPWARRVHGISGIYEAHQAAEMLVDTEYFFTVDGDNQIDPEFDWENIPNHGPGDDCVHVWRCRNAVNGLTYGYGGVKLWPRNHLQTYREIAVDITTCVADGRFRVQPVVASTTVFNTTPFNAWRAGFRECVKLASGTIRKSDAETSERLRIWTTVGQEAQYGAYCIRGAGMGMEYGMQHRGDLTALRLINDFQWLRELFQTQTGVYVS